MPNEHLQRLHAERRFTDIAPTGVPVSFHFEGLTAGQKVSFTLARGGHLTGALYSAPGDAEVAGDVLSFTTPTVSGMNSDIWLEFEADVQFFDANVFGSLLLHEPATARMTIPNTNVSAILRDGPFCLNLGFGFPPTCILQYDRYAIADVPCPSDGNFARKTYLYHGRFFCCVESPF